MASQQALHKLSLRLGLPRCMQGKLKIIRIVSVPWPLSSPLVW